MNYYNFGRNTNLEDRFDSHFIKKVESGADYNTLTISTPAQYPVFMLFGFRYNTIGLLFNGTDLQGSNPEVKYAEFGNELVDSISASKGTITIKFKGPWVTLSVLSTFASSYTWS